MWNSTDKDFGILFFVILLISAIFVTFYYDNLISNILYSISLLLLVITIFKPSLLNKIKHKWITLGNFLGKIISFFILTLIFFLIFTPVGIFIKLIGRDELKLELKKLDSYWIRKNNQNRSFMFKDQFSDS